MTSVQLFTIRTHTGQRLDNFLIRELKPLPRSRIMRMIRRGEVRVNGKRAKVHLKLNDGDRVRVPPFQLADDSQNKVPPWLIDIVRNNVIFDDSRLCVVNKPSGIAVHSGTSITVGLVDAVREHFGDHNIQLAHRIDRDTSGCVLFAKSRVALLEFQYALQNRNLVKRYEGIVVGNWPFKISEVSVPLRTYRLPNGERRVEVHSEGKAALTKFKILRTAERCTWLGIEPRTGRTHQIRVHCQHQGHSLVGDNKYGQSEPLKSTNMLLHAAGIQLVDGRVVESKIPSHFEEFWMHQSRSC